MQDAPDPRQDESHASAWLAGITAGVLLYTLSPGPLTWWIDRMNGGDVPAWVLWVYAPVIFLNDHFGPVAEFYEFYCGLFEG